MAQTFEERLATDELIILDGATGSELQRRGVPVPAPLWSADAVDTHGDLLQRIHAEYLDAGAHVITANTFRTAPYSLRKVGRAPEAEALTQRTVATAKQACHDAGCGWVAGSLAPLEDCYRPDRVPGEGILVREHTAHANNLAAAGVDLILVETMNNVPEAVVASQAARQTGLPVLLSVMVNAATPEKLLSGEPIEDLYTQIKSQGISGLLVNCSPCDPTSAALEHLATILKKTACFGAYANAGGIDAYGKLTMDSVISPTEYAAFAQKWRKLGAKVIGGCCCTGPAHIRRIRGTLL